MGIDVVKKVCTCCGDNLPISLYRTNLKRGKPYCRTQCMRCEAIKEGERRMAKNPIMEIKGEKWVTIFNGKYAISNKERLKVFGKRIMFIAKPSLGKNGYYCHTINLNGKAKRMTLHRLIALNFIPNPHNYPTVNHKNGIKTDNRIENLEWCSYAYNNKHARDTGLNKGARGENTGNAALNNNQVLDIFNSTEKRGVLSIKYKVSKDCIDDIRSGANWSWLTGKVYNPRKILPIEYKGKKLFIYQWAEYFKVNRSTLQERIANGQSFENIYNFYKRKNGF